MFIHFFLFWFSWSDLHFKSSTSSEHHLQSFRHHLLDLLEHEPPCPCFQSKHIHQALSTEEVKLPTISTNGKAEVERVREEKRRSERRKNEKKKDAGARKCRKAAIHCVSSNDLWLWRAECTTKFAQSTPQYYFALQSLHMYFPVILCTTRCYVM